MSKNVGVANQPKTVSFSASEPKNIALGTKDVFQIRVLGSFE